jgi:hypothetical protein
MAVAFEVPCRSCLQVYLVIYLCLSHFKTCPSFSNDKNLDVDADIAKSGLTLADSHLKLGSVWMVLRIEVISCRHFIYIVWSLDLKESFRPLRKVGAAVPSLLGKKKKTFLQSIRLLCDRLHSQHKVICSKIEGYAMDERSGFGRFFNFGSRRLLSFFLLLRSRTSLSPSPCLLLEGVRSGVCHFGDKENALGVSGGGLSCVGKDIVGSPVCVRDPEWSG